MPKCKYSRYDIYYNIYQSLMVTRLNFDYFRKLVKKSKIYFTPRISVSWGMDNKIKCELLMLK